jgi:GT2 family glycosyltransferase
VGIPRTFSAVICAYTVDRWAELQAAVTSMRRQSRRPDEIILVVDHNPELLARAATAFRDVRCVPNACSQGLSGARNTGVELAGYDVIGFLDDDAVAAPDWVERLMQAYEDEAVLGVGGWIRPDWRAPRPDWLPEEFLWVVGCSYAGLPTTRTEVRNPIGANMSFRREVLTAVGGFDPRFGRSGADAAGCEETEFAIRARRAYTGGRIVLEPAASCAHAVGPDRVTRRYFRRRCAAEGRSKALVSRLAGSKAALSTERAYVWRILPRAVGHGLRATLQGDRHGASRAWSIVEGTALAAVSYLATTWRLGRCRPRDRAYPAGR